MTLGYVMGLALILGFKHSFDADHLLAVSAFLRRARSVGDSVRLGMSWAIGHMITAGIITIFLFMFRETVMSALLPHVELFVALMLILFGVLGFHESIWHKTVHAHEKQSHSHLLILDSGISPHTHRLLFAVGALHGLASNNELLMLLTLVLGVTALAGMLLGVALFSLGVVFGMIVFCLVFSLSWFRIYSDTSRRLISSVTGCLSVVIGVSMLIGI